MSTILRPPAGDEDQINETTESVGLWWDMFENHCCSRGRTPAASPMDDWSFFLKMQLMAHWSLCPASNQSHKFLACVHQLSRQLNQLTYSRSTYIEMIKSVIYLNSSREWICLILSTLYYFPFLVSQCPHLFFFPCYYGSHQFLGNACLFWIHCAGFFFWVSPRKAMGSVMMAPSLACSVSCLLQQ